MDKAAVKSWMLDHPSEPIPNDAIYLARIAHFDKFLDFVEDTMTKSGKSVREVCAAIKKNEAAVAKLFEFAGNAIPLFLSRYGA